MLVDSTHQGFFINIVSVCLSLDYQLYTDDNIKISDGIGAAFSALYRWNANSS